MNDESVFAAAIAISNPSERAAYLDRACAGNTALRREVEALLAAHQRDNPLDRPVALEPTLAYERAAERPGSLVGKYKLLQQIGEGGMGTVWMAEQTDPVRRMVALKIIKPGMDSSQVIARFEAERQALALMDHPNIAKVLDAGTTESGRPFFVMELVKGVPITEYCDEQRLEPIERLKLFIPVCQAIQHAHQKGVIHRDIKPSNVLVAAYDGRPVPKVIDFGVVKAMGQKLTERTLFTGFGGIVGTLEYMSPEQAEFNALDIDTRSDIYSLGVLLYELLTGTTPLTKDRLRQAAITEVLRVIREEEPPPPSTRLTQSSGSLESISAQRRTDPRRLPRLVRGELDWIAMKALDKDRSRRYESALGMARDIERYLQNERVEACPPTVAYRLSKFARRHRRAVAVGAALSVLVAIMLVNHFVGYVRLKEARARAAKEFLRAQMAAAEARDERDRARQAQIDAEQARQAEALAKNTAMAMAAAEMQAKRDAVQALEKAQNEEAVAKEVNELVWRIFRDASDSGKSDKQITLQTLLDGASARFDKPSESHTLATAKVLELLALGYQLCDDQAKAQTQLELVCRVYEERLGIEHTDTQKAMRALARVYHRSGKNDQALSIYQRLLELGRGQGAWDYPGLLYELGFLHHAEMKYQAAEPIWIEFLQGRGYANSSSNRLADLMTGQAMQQLAQCYSVQDKFNEAEPLFMQAMQRIRAAAGDGGTVFILTEIGRMRIRQKEYIDAEARLRQAAATFEATHPNDWRRFDALSLLGTSLAGQKKYDVAEPLLIQGYEGMKECQQKITRQDRVTKEARSRVTEALAHIVQLYEAWEKPDQAAAWRAKRDDATRQTEQ